MMEQKKISVDTQVLMQHYRQLLQSVQTLPLVVTGGSMLPFLAGGRDTVYLTAIDRRLRRGDMALYQRENGTYVLHRVYAVKKDSYTMLGDAQTQLEPGIRHEQVVARVTAVLRKGKRLQPGCFFWDFFEKIWPGLRALHTPSLRIYGALRRTFGRKT